MIYENKNGAVNMHHHKTAWPSKISVLGSRTCHNWREQNYFDLPYYCIAFNNAVLLVPRVQP